jgi:hypothetical protein
LSSDRHLVLCWEALEPGGTVMGKNKDKGKKDKGDKKKKKDKKKDKKVETPSITPPNAPTAV